MEIACRQAGFLTILDLTGRCAVSPGESEIAALRSTIMRLIAEGRVHVAANLAALTSVDTRGLAEFVFAHRALVAAGGELTLVAPNVVVRKMLSATRLDALFRLYDSETELM
jgi:anti-anti-sigma factor